MVILNIILVGLSTRLKTDLPKRFTYILCKSNCMDQIQHGVYEYDKECTVFLGIMECHQKRADTTSEEAATDDSETAGAMQDKGTYVMVAYETGEEINRFLNGYSHFKGHLTAVGGNRRWRQGHTHA